MKPTVAITLIITGGFLIAAPIIADYLERAQGVEALRNPGVTHVNLQPSLSGEYRFGCWIAGCAMIVSAILSSRHSNSGQSN